MDRRREYCREKTDYLSYAHVSVQRDEWKARV